MKIKEDYEKLLRNILALKGSGKIISFFKNMVIYKNEKQKEEVAKMIRHHSCLKLGTHEYFLLRKLGERYLYECKHCRSWLETKDSLENIESKKIYSLEDF